MVIDGNTRITGIVGSPVRHTRSPGMHNAAFRKLGLDYVYLAFDVLPKDLADAVKGFRAMGISGLNVTIPHKVRIMEMLDGIRPEAAAVGAVNTVINVKGRLIGDNTDSTGFLASLEKDCRVRLRGKRVLLMGCGGAGLAIGSVLARKQVSVLYLYDVLRSRARALSKKLGSGEVITVRELASFRDVDLLINATPIGMKPSDGLVCPEGLVKRSGFVYDIVYNRTTPLLAAARKYRIRHAGGLGMLLHQGALSFSMWTGKRAPVDVMRRALMDSMKVNR